MNAKTYLRFGAMIATSTLVMFGLMYLIAEMDALIADLERNPTPSTAPDLPAYTQR